MRSRVLSALWVAALAVGVGAAGAPAAGAAPAPADDVIVFGPAFGDGDITTVSQGYWFRAGGPVGGTAVATPPANGAVTLSTTGVDGVTGSIRLPFPFPMGRWATSVTLTRNGQSCVASGYLDTRLSVQAPDGSPQQLVADFEGTCALFTSSIRKVAASVRVNAPDHAVAVPAAEPTAVYGGATVGHEVVRTIQVRNDGAKPWSIADVGTGRASGSTQYFTVDSASDTCTGHTLEPDATCVVTIRAVAPSQWITEHVIVRGDALTPLVVPISVPGHDVIPAPTGVTASTSRANTWVGWSPATSRPTIGYRVYDVTNEGRVLLGTASPDATSLIIPAIAGRTVAVVAANSTSAESLDVTVAVPAGSATDVLVNQRGSGSALLPDTAEDHGRLFGAYWNHRLDVTRSTWLAVRPDTLFTCPVATEQCSPVHDLGPTPDPAAYLMDAAWLPDGRILLLRGEESLTRSLWSIKADGSGLTRLASGANLDGLAVTPSGAEVVSRDTNSVELVRVRLADGRRTPVPGTTGAEYFSVSNQGKLVVTTTGDGGFGAPTTTRVMNLDGAASKNLALPAGDNRYVTFDPTGSRVTWARYTESFSATMWVAAADGSGSRRLSAASGAWNDPVWSAADTQRPIVALTAPSVSSGNATLSVGASDPDGPSGSLRRQCRLDASTTWIDCPTAWTLTGLAAGKHTAYARVTDAVGHVSAVATTSWIVDRTTPVAAVVTPTATQLSLSMVLRWTSSDAGGAGVLGHDIRVRAASPSAGYGPYTYPASLQGRTSLSATVAIVQGRQYCFAVRARDKVGNLGAWSTEKCTAVALDDRGLATTGTWVRGRSSSYAFDTYTKGTRSGITLTKSGVQAKRLSVVATTCATCGALDVYHAGKYLGRVSLYSSTTRVRQERYLPLQSVTRTGSVTLKTVGAKPVYVDGIVIRH